MPLPLCGLSRDCGLQNLGPPPSGGWVVCSLIFQGITVAWGRRPKKTDRRCFTILPEKGAMLLRCKSLMLATSFGRVAQKLSSFCGTPPPPAPHPATWCTLVGLTVGATNKEQMVVATLRLYSLGQPHNHARARTCPSSPRRHGAMLTMCVCVEEGGGAQKKLKTCTHCEVQLLHSNFSAGRFALDTAETRLSQHRVFDLVSRIGQHTPTHIIRSPC